MKLFLTTLACAALLGAQQPVSPVAPSTVPAAKVDPNTVVLTIGDRHITAAEYEQIVKSIVPAQMQPLALGPAKRAYAQKIVELLVLSDEAQRQKLDQKPPTSDQLDLQRRTTLSVHEYQKIHSDIPVTDAQIQAYYDANQAQYTTIRARHILIRVKGSITPAKPGKPELTDADAIAKAKAVRQRILAGEDFAKVAKEESDDSSADKGGELGEIARGRTVPQFETAAFALKPDELSEPVRTPFGYHIIQVESRTVKPLADVKEDILTRLRQQAGPAIVEEMVAKSGYHLDEKFFGAEPAAPAPAKPATPPAPAPAPATPPK
ncbi:MAG TPA: peptidylprolyl isomerase [Bryobacteraceae bacterium]|nr:peptidylprolyl isomerase [Bryobacteraceae bacterium]